MSFLLGALGSAGTQLLKSAGGALLERGGRAILGRIGSYFTNALGGDQKAGKLGRSVMDRLYTNGVNAAYGGMQKFANSKFLQNKMPILAPALSDAAGVFKNRMHQGYRELMGGGGGGINPYTGPGHYIGGIEKMDTMG